MGINHIAGLIAVVEGMALATTAAIAQVSYWASASQRRSSRTEMAAWTVTAGHSSINSFRRSEIGKI
ncbi:hypothetical protein [Ensifer sp. MJa1]|uniref:hypothetical protein n=1 Tax=Ensifer sp. MJa1 TaxID=2919888 RepID=UPI003007F96B